jgi:hypothetical protein
MKKIRLLIGVVALTFAFVSSFALKSSSTLIAPAYIGSSGCQTASVTCSGNNQNCQQQIPNVGTKTIFDYDLTSDCGPVLRMQ